MTQVKAHITGTVWKVEVAEGDQVKKGDVLVTLESMKMEMPVEAPADGVVKTIHCQAGQAIAEDALIADLE